MKSKILKKGRTASVFCILVFILLIFLSGCGKSKEENQITEAKPVSIGVILPLTGEAAYLGKMVQNGMQLALEEVNSRIKEEKHKITLIFEDSANAPKNAVSAFHKLITVNKVDAVVCVSGGWKALIPLAERAKYVLFCTVVSPSKVAAMSPWAFRFFVSADEDASLMARFAVNRLKVKTAAVIYANDEFGVSYNQVFSDTFKNEGGKIVASEAFPEDTTDFRTILYKFKKLNPDVVYILAYGNNLALIPLQMREIGLKTKILSLGTISQPNIMKQAGDTIIGAYYTSTEFSTFAPRTRELRAFVEKYKSKYGQVPVFFEVFGYDTIGIINKAITSNPTPDSIREGLLKIKDYPGAVGKVTFSAEGEATFPLMVYTITKDGKTPPVDFQ